VGEAVLLAPGPWLGPNPSLFAAGRAADGSSGGGGHPSALPVAPPETLVIDLPDARNPTGEAEAGSPALRSPPHFAMGHVNYDTDKNLNAK
jgi:hypothetical protein